MVPHLEYNILNGDALNAQLKDWQGHKIICRECMMEGPVSGITLREIREQRSHFFTSQYGVTEKEYIDTSYRELLKILTIEKNSSINLWFENDLFCQVNLWFVLQLISEKNHLYLVSPIDSSWSGFGKMSNEELKVSYQKRKRISSKQIGLFSALWEGYQQSDWRKMRESSRELKILVADIEAVVEAHIVRFSVNSKLGRPEQKLIEIVKENPQISFEDIFFQFNETEGIYGFGDVQVRRMLRDIKKC